MKKNFIFISKNIMVYMISLAIYPLIKKIAGTTIGNVPQIIRDNYADSYFIKKGWDLPALIILMSTIIVFLLINFHIIKDGIHNNRLLKGLIYGFSIGVLWFAGFIEMIVFFYSKNIGHVYSGIRDLSFLTFFGLIAGCILCKSDNTKIKRKSGNFLVIPFVAIFFAIFHGLQFYLTYQPIHVTINSFVDVLWLLATGSWIGFMYYLFSPGINFKKKYHGIMFFAFSVFGTNWLLYNSFYYIFVNAPFTDLFVRCISDILGVFIGLIIFEWFTKRNRINL